MSLLGVETSVRERLGMDPHSLGLSALPQAVEKRMKARGVKSAEEYLGLLTRDRSENDSLADELVVPESWFFRGGRALFTRMAEFVAARIASRTTHREVRILSIPCSTGEEPYSLAIACHECFIPPTDYRIDAVDVSAKHLERAEAARFSAFSYREAGNDIRPAYFRQNGDRWELLPHLQQLVRFRVANLTDPAFLIQEQPYDLIVCRNVFIYLTPDGKRRAMASLDRLLAIDGLMCLTPGEADRLPPGQFTLAVQGEFGLYRRVCAEPVVLATETQTRTPEPKTPLPRQVGHFQAPLVEKPPVVLASPLVEPQPRVSPLDLARQLADLGQLTEARASCERAIRESGVSAAGYTLLGTIHLAEGRTDEAAETFRRALYLDPQHKEAITHMIVVNDRKGNTTQAEALRRRLARLSLGDAK